METREEQLERIAAMIGQLNESQKSSFVLWMFLKHRSNNSFSLIYVFLGQAVKQFHNFTAGKFRQHTGNFIEDRSRWLL